MPNPTIRIHNTQTDEVIDREMTNEEFAIYEADAVASQARQIAEEAEAAAKAEAKAALLDRLGITADEAALLLA